MIVRVLLLIVLSMAFSIQAQTIKESYAFSVLGEPRYAFNFDHFDYVNPAAPKGDRSPFPPLAPLTTSIVMPCAATPARVPSSFTTRCSPRRTMSQAATTH